MTRKYMPRKERKQLITSAILRCIHEKGFFDFTIDDVAESSECGIGTVKSHFGILSNLREEILRHAKENNIQEVLNIPISEMIK